MMHLTIMEGAASDFAALESMHYRGGRLPGVDHVLVARHEGELAGVLVVTRPVLNASWRSQAWPEVPRGDRREAAVFINAHVRRIARVVVAPKLRGVGVGSALVRAYLAAPRTTHTEVVASMARGTPLFASAGMREVAAAPPERNLVFGRALAAADVEPWELMDVKLLRELLRTNSALCRACEAWARGSRHSRTAALSREGLLRESLYAASQVAWPSRVFVSP